MISILSDSIRSFWAWFRTTEDHLFTLAEHPEELFGLLIPRLQQVHPGLVAELGPQTNGCRELAISAGGCLDVFPAVLAATALVPELKRWRIIAFRQPKPDCFTLSTPEFDITTSQFSFQADPTEDLLHLELYYSGGSDLSEAMLERAGFFLVDLMLGEFTMEVYIGRCITRRGNPDEGRPLRDLPSVVDAHTARVADRSERRAWGKAM